jgi:hypothetical protein
MVLRCFLYWTVFYLQSGSCSRTKPIKYHLQEGGGSYTYRRIPFGLINTCDTFQRDMDITFKGLIGQSVVIHLDDVTVYLKQRVDHPKSPKICETNI